MKSDPQTTAARAFVRSLNILLKFARLYGHDHARVAEQLKIAWGELRTAVPAGSDASLLLGASGTQLLLDGVPLEGTPAEKQFAQLLSSAGLASVQFTLEVSEEELARFAQAFPTGKAKPTELVQQLKAAIADAQGIRVNEVCFVATDSRLKEASLAAQIAASSLGEQQEQFRKMLNDPKKLLELIAAVEGSKSSGEGDGTTEGEGGAGRESGTTPAENEFGGPGLGIGKGPGHGRGFGAAMGPGAGAAAASGSGASSAGKSTGKFGFVGGTGSGWGGGFGFGPGSGGVAGANGGAATGNGEKRLGITDEESIFHILRPSPRSEALEPAQIRQR